MSECVFDLGKKCVALTEKKCSKCKFAKTAEQLEEGCKKAKRRLNNKYTPEEQATMFRKYYPIRGLG